MFLRKFCKRAQAVLNFFSGTLDIYQHGPRHRNLYFWESVMVALSYLVYNDILSQNVTYHYKMWPLLFYKMRKKFIAKFSRFLITKWDIFIINWTVFQKCDGFITNFDNYYKMQRLLQNVSLRPAISINILSTSVCVLAWSVLIKEQPLK